MKILLAVWTLAFMGIAAAQEFRGTILGRITDPSGAAIAGAAVQVENADTNAVLRTASNEAGNWLDGPVSARLGGRRDAGGRILNPYFDITAFLPLADQYTVTPEPPALDELRAPRTRSLNLALFKSFPIREKLKLEVRMEATGATNSPIFDAPGTNMNQAATFGVISSAGGSRAMQGSARLVF